MRNVGIFVVCLALAGSAGAGSRPPDIPFERHTLDLGANESCTLADVNRDGRVDIVSGENWYEAPSWTKHRFRDLHFQNNYIDAFSDLPMDVDGDGWTDIITATWFSKKISWYKNPGKGGGAWKETPIIEGNNTEFAFLVDMDNDGKPNELLPQFGNKTAPTAWFENKGGKWVQHTVSPKNFGHGIGAGDVNGDGRADVLTAKGWLEAPANPRAENWAEHTAWEFKEHLSFIHVHDVNGDKRPDVIFGNAHDYGIYWLENMADGTWKKREIDSAWSQPHEVVLVDLNGDGKLDILSGKRFLAHDHDPGAQDPVGIFWYETVPGPGGNGVAWVRHTIDYGGRAGGGMQMPVADLDGDGDLDFVAPGKGGLFLFENVSKNAGGKK